MTFTLTPPRSSLLNVAVFVFRAPEGSRYSYRLDGGAWTTVRADQGRSGSATVVVSRGQHTFQVVAVNGSGRPMGPVASYTWTVT